MANKITSMFSRLAAQFLKPTLALLAALAVGGAWAAGWWQSGTEWSSVVWDGNSNEYFFAPWSDLSLSFSGACKADNNVRIGNDDYNSENGHTITFSAASNSESDGLSITGSLNVGENGDQGILNIKSGRYTASTGLFVSGGDSKYGSLIMDGGYLDVTGEVQFGNAENSICTNYINAGATIANNNYFCVGRAAGTDTYLEVNGGTVQTTGILTIGTCGSEASKGEMVVKSGTVTADYIKVGEFDTATLTISGGNVTGTTGLMLADAAPDNSRTWNTEGFTANEKATLNLDGGVLSTPSIVRGNGAGSGNTYVNFNGGTLAASAAGTLIGSGLTVTFGSNGGTIDVGANNVTIAATVSGSGTIIKKGTGTLTFTGGMSGFTGQIIVAEGGAVTVSEGAGATAGVGTTKTDLVFTTDSSTYIWIGALNSNWNNKGNWQQNGSTASDYPNSSTAVVFFPSDASVTIEGSYLVNSIFIAANTSVVLNGSGNTHAITGIANLGYPGVSAAKLVVNNVNLQSSDCKTDGYVSWYADIGIGGDTTVTNYITAYSTDSTNGRALRLYGNIFGTGNVRLSSTGSSSRCGVSLYSSSNEKFYGVCVIESAKGAARGPYTFCSAGAGSSNAAWKYIGSNEDNQSNGSGRVNVGDSIVKFGTYEGDIMIFGQSSSKDNGDTTRSGNTLELGGKGVDFTCSINAHTTSDASRAEPTGTILRKVGDGVMTLGDGVGNPCITEYDFNAGVLKFANPYILSCKTYNNATLLPIFKFTGGTVAFDAEKCVDSTGAILDISSQLSSSSTSAISILVDEGQSISWKAQLNSTTAPYGVIKKGKGTLTLTNAPDWTSPQQITVLDGKLVVNDSSFANYTLGEGTKVTTVDSTLVFAPDARATVTFADTETYSLSVSVNNSAIASGDKIDAGETLVISANAIVGYKVTSIVVNGVAISGNEYSVATGDVEGGVAISAVAEAVVATIDNMEYASLEDALADAVSGDVIALCGNVVLDKNLSLGEGVTVNANGYTITRGEYSVYCPDGYHELSESAQIVYLRTAYVWNGGAAGTWTDSVWLVNGETSSAPSQASDIVVVSTEATIAMNSGRTGQLYLDADVTLTGTLTVDVIKGSGMITFSGTTLNGGNGQQVYCDAYFTGTVNANTASLSLYGKFKGDAANISFTSSGSYSPGFTFYGDVSDFTGLYTGGRANINSRDSTKIYSKEFNGAAGSWDFDRHENLNDGYAFQGGDNATYKFGWLKNEKFTLVTYHASSGDTIAKNCEVEVGAVANKNSAINGTLSDDSNIFRKVGATSTCDLTLTESKGTVEIKEGLLNLAGMLPNEIKFTGGTLKTALDPSACIESSTSAIVFDDWGETYEWASAIANSNTGGFTKKGSGTLTLSQPPAYAGTTKVEDGVLYVINGEYSLTPDSSTAEVTSDKDGYRKFVPAKKVIGLIFLAF